MTGFSGTGKREGIDVNPLFDEIAKATEAVQSKMKEIEGNNEDISIGDMFEMQMLMNHLSQISEASTSIISAMNTAIKSMATNAGR
jgi:hypothetical protein